MMRTAHALILPLAISLLSVAAPAMGQAEDDAYGDDYRAGDYGRVRYVDGGATLRRAASDTGAAAEESGLLNSPVFPGDTLITDFGQRAEVQLAGGSVVRIDRGTEVTFLALPDPYATVADNTILQLPEGTLRVDALLGEEEEFRIDTPASSIYLIGDGDFRIDVEEDGFTRLFSRRGVSEVVGQGGSVLVRGGTRADVRPGSLPREAEPFNTFASDSFDRWVEKRETAYRGEDYYADSGEVYEELPREVRPYYRELSANGSWVYTSDYGYVWYPSGVAVGWRPYTDGYWEYGPHGYFWVSYKPWGWAPYHYGRWAWVASRGWCWIPGRIFAGAWVAWSWGSLYVGWSPLDYWNRPCYVRSIYYDYYDPYAWTFVHYNHFYHHRYHRYAVSVHDIGHRLHGHAVVTRPPRVRPRDLARSERTRDRAVRLAREDRVAGLRPSAEKARRDRRNLKDLERNMMPVGRRDRSSAIPRDRLASDRPSNGGTRGPAVNRGSRPARSDGVGDARTPPRFKRQLTGETSDSGRRIDRGAAASRGRAGVDRGREPARATPPDRTRTEARRGGSSRTATPRRVDSPETDRRVRDLYQKMSRPRTSRGTTAGPESDRPSRPSSRNTSAVGSQGSRRPAPKARSQTPPPRPQPKARPSAPGPRSQPKARPSAPGPRSQPKARPSAPGPRSQPKSSGSRSSGRSRSRGNKK